MEGEGPSQKKEEVPTYQSQSQSQSAATTTTSGKATATAAAWLLLLGLGGAALLVWWALVFHPSNQQLWMVPVSLVLLGTPMVAWLSIFTSSACRRFDMMRTMRLRAAGTRQEPAISICM